MQVEEVMQQTARLQEALSNARASLEKTTENVLQLIKGHSGNTFQGWLLETIHRLTEAAAPRAEPIREDSLWLSAKINSLELELQSV
jgi:hypothetical protein